MNDPKLKIFIYDEMIRAGVMPWQNDTHDMNSLLKGLSEEEQRKLKRKFRKLWRKAFEKAYSTVKDEALRTHYRNRYGKKGSNPTRRQRQERRKLVRDQMVHNAHHRALKLKEDGIDLVDERK